LARVGTEKSVIGRGLVLEQGREALGTTPLDAQPNVILKMPGDTLVPLCLALAMSVLTIGLALVNWFVVATGVVLIAAAILAWLWPSASLGETAEVDRDG
jgi:cytochrome c oxidase subunit 1/cytochrome c oxidase subunit I+III